MDAGRRTVTAMLLGLAGIFLAAGVVLGVILGPAALVAVGGHAVILLVVQGLFWLAWSREDARSGKLGPATDLDRGRSGVAPRPSERSIGQSVDFAPPRTDRGPMRVVRRVITITLLVQVAWMAPIAVALGLLLDTAFLYAFGGGALAVLVVWLCFMLAWQRTDARRDSLLSTGARVPALLVSSRATNSRINNRTVMAHTFESRSGGRVIRARTKAFSHFPPGIEATIAYDPADPSNAVVVEDLDSSRNR
jgi:hypothetical protein